MSADSCIMLCVVARMSGSYSTHVEAARCLLTSCLTSDRHGCIDAIRVLGVEWLRRQSLAPLTWHACNSVMALPSELSLPLQQAYYSAAGDAELHRRELAHILRQLNRRQIQAIVFKGAALAHSVYPDPACRTMGDIDLWVPGEDIERAHSVLREMGYESFSKFDRPPALMAIFQGEIGLQHRHSEYGLVELHWGIFSGEWLRQAALLSDLSAIYTRVGVAQLAGETAIILSPEDAILQSAIHTVINHQMSMAPLRGLVDIALLARHDHIDWTVIVERARVWRVATPSWLVLSLAVDLAGLHEAAEAARRLQPSRLRRHLIRRFASAESLVMKRDLAASKWRYVFLLLLVDRVWDAAKLVFRALWPERAWLIARYGQYTAGTRLQHLLDAARGKI